MALVKCPECGREKVSDSAEACPDCGYPIKNYFEQLEITKEVSTNQESIKEIKSQIDDITCCQKKYSQEAELKESKQTSKTKLILIGAFIGIITIIVLVIYIIVPISKYSKATKYFEQENFEQAQSLYEDLGSYKDSLTMVEKCKLGTVEQNINMGINLEESLEYLHSVESTENINTLKRECLLKLIDVNYSKNNYAEALAYIYETEETEKTKKIRIDCLWNLANAEYSFGNYIQVIRYLDEISDFSLLEKSEDAQIMLENSLKNYGMDSYHNGDFSTALLYLKRLNQKDNIINEYISTSEFLNKMQGIWCFQGGYKKSVIEYSGWNYTLCEYGQNGEVLYDSSYDIRDLYESIYIKNSQLHLERTGTFACTIKIYLRNGNLVEVQSGDRWNNYEESEFEFKKIESFPEPAKEPYVGMTVAEVLASTWGEPEDINKTTYAWGVKEQWCYSGYRYIYLEDGIVTSISE